jgi:signal transduction histidine kinase
MRSLILSLVLFWVTPVFGQPEIELTSSHFIPQASDKFYFQLIDGNTDAERNPPGVWSLSDSGRQWWFNPGQTLFSRILVTNRTQDDSFVIYAPDNYTMESMSFRIESKDGQSSVVRHTGSVREYRSRALQTRYLAAEFSLAPGESATITVSQWGTYKYKHNFHIMSKPAFTRLNTTNNQFFGFYFGILAISIVIFTAVYIGLRDRSFIMYVVFCVAFFLNALSNIGFIGEWFGFIPGQYIGSIARGLLSIPMFTAILFCQALLETKAHTPRWHRFLNILIVLNVLYLAARMLPGHSAILSLGFTFLVLTSLIALTAIGIYRWIQGYRPAILYTAAWIFVFIGVVAWLLQSYNIIANTFWSVHAAYITQSIEVMLLAATVVDRYSLVLKDAFRAKALIKERERLKDLLRMISHDLSNPLTVLSYGSARLLAGKNIERNDLQTLGAKFERATKAMTNILEGVRHMTPIEDGKVSLKIAPVPFTEVFSELREIFQDRMREKQVSLVLRDPEALILYVSRTEFIYQVLCNIISNAIKFSDKGGQIIVTAGPSVGVREVSVQDFGVGMPPRLVENVFVKDNATSRPGTLGEKGTGFGMPIMKSYVEMMGGSVRVESKVKGDGVSDHGTTFILSFPDSGLT